MEAFQRRGTQGDCFALSVRRLERERGLKIHRRREEEGQEEMTSRTQADGQYLLLSHFPPALSPYSLPPLNCCCNAGSSCRIKLLHPIWRSAPSVFVKMKKMNDIFPSASATAVLLLLVTRERLLSKKYPVNFFLNDSFVRGFSVVLKSITEVKNNAQITQVVSLEFSLLQSCSKKPTRLLRR